MWEPLWLFGLLGGATEADARGEEALNGRTCLRFALRADVPRAAADSRVTFRSPQASTTATCSACRSSSGSTRRAGSGE
jgi:hypothetical protein